MERIRGVLASSPFHGEGHRKAWARLRHQGTRTSKERVRRLMRAHGLSAPHHPRRVRGDKAQDRRITTDMPNELWGTDATQTLTQEGTAIIFLAVDHCTAECVGIHAARRARFEALEPIRQAVRQSFGDDGKEAASGLSIRHDHGSQSMNHDFQAELKFLGIRSTPAFVAEPECNGLAERFIRTLNEQLLWLETFDSVEPLDEVLHRFKQGYNHGWLVQKHGYRTPSQVRTPLSQPTSQAA